jgi:hypothetical protein
MRLERLQLELAWRALMLAVLAWIAAELHDGNQWRSAPESAQATAREELQKGIDDMRRRVVALDAKFERLSEAIERQQP